MVLKIVLKIAYTTQNLPPGHDQPFAIWQSLNRLCTKFGRCGANLYKEGFQSNDNTESVWQVDYGTTAGVSFAPDRQHDGQPQCRYAKKTTEKI